MALLGCGWAVGRGLVTLAAVGFSFHLKRKVQHLEQCVRKLEDKEELRDLHAEGFEMQTSEYAVLHPEVSKDLMLKHLKTLQLEKLSRDLEGLKRCVQELENDNKSSIELCSAASQRGECMEGKLAVAEMQVKEHTVVKEEVSKDLMQLETQKSELEREVERLQRLVRELEDNKTMLTELYTAASQGREYMKEKLLLAEKKAEDYAVLNKEASKDFKHLQSKKQELESSLDHALEKVKEKQRAFEAYSAEVEISMATALEKAQETMQEIISIRIGFASDSRKNSTSLGKIRKNSFGSINTTSTWQTSTKLAIPPVISLRDEDGEKSVAASSLTPSACSKSIGRDLSSASPLIKWQDNPLYETQATRHTTAALSGDEEVTNGSKSISRDSSSASPFVEWHHNPLYETQTTRQAAGHEENGANFVGRDPTFASPFIKWRYNPLYET